jgi:hypothetical protein
MGLTPDENEELRRIHVLSQFGELPETMRARFTELRARDVNLEIPEPTLDIQWIPQQRGRDDAMDNLADRGYDVDDIDDIADQDDLAKELADFDWVLVRDA